MKFLADENFPGDAIESLRIKGFQINWIGKESPGISDELVLEKAINEGRILITFDKDFGELAFKRGLPASCGIILFRIPPLPPATLVKFIEIVLESRDNWKGYFSVVDLKRVRMRPILSLC